MGMPPLRQSGSFAVAAPGGNLCSHCPLVCEVGAWLRGNCMRQFTAFGVLPRE